jgi:protein CMS1
MTAKTMTRPLKSQPPEYESDPGSKRKRLPESNKKENPRSKRSRHNPADIEDLHGDGINTTIAQMGSSLLADHIAQKTKKFETDLSLIELEDRYISSKYCC